MTRLVVVTAMILVGTLAFTARAGAAACAEDEMPIPDERTEGASICLKKSEWEKAKETCARIAAETGEADPGPMTCICQDGDSAGACGD